MALQVQAALNEEFRQRPAIDGPDREQEADYQFLLKMNDLLGMSPNIVLRTLEENLLDAHDLKRHTKAAASRVGLRQDDAYRRHTLAHFVARNLRPEMAAAIGVETFPVG